MKADKKAKRKAKVKERVKARVRQRLDATRNLKSDLLFDEAKWYAQSEQFDKAILLMERALRLAPDNVEMIRFLGYLGHASQRTAVDLKLMKYPSRRALIELGEWAMQQGAKMEIIIRCDCSGVDWKTVSETLQRVGMTYYAPETHQRAFEASHTTVFAYQGDRLIGFGRAISDGVCQGAVYDVAVVPEFQHQGIGTIIMKRILERLSGCNVILYASPGKEAFYQKLALRKMKTGMARFKNPEIMREKGFTE